MTQQLPQPTLRQTFRERGDKPRVTKNLVVRLDPELRERIREKAKSRNINTSEYIRQILMLTA